MIDWLLKNGWKEKYKNVFRKETPRELGYWTEVQIDLRFGWDSIQIKGIRGSEDDILVDKVRIPTEDSLEILLYQIYVINA